MRLLSAFLMLVTACNCATVPNVTQPISDKGNLLALFEKEPKDPPECTGHILLTDEISDPSDFVAAMKACKGEPVVVEINSPGGSLFAALEMQKAIERHDKPVLCMVDGMAASAAFITLQSCDIRTMTNRSVLMAHHAAAQTGGQEERLQNLANALKAIDHALTLFCAKRMGMEPAEFEKRVSGGQEWWMAVEDATAANAIDFEVDGLNDALKLVHDVNARAESLRGQKAAPDAGSP